MKGCWYFITYWCCPLCGHTTENRERRTTPKPDTPYDRHKYIEYACSGHFI